MWKFDRFQTWNNWANNTDILLLYVGLLRIGVYHFALEQENQVSLERADRTRVLKGQQMWMQCFLLVWRRNFSLKIAVKPLQIETWLGLLLTAGYRKSSLFYLTVPSPIPYNVSQPFSRQGHSRSSRTNEFYLIWKGLLTFC